MAVGPGGHVADGLVELDGLTGRSQVVIEQCDAPGQVAYHQGVAVGAVPIRGSLDSGWRRFRGAETTTSPIRHGATTFDAGDGNDEIWEGPRGLGRLGCAAVHQHPSGRVDNHVPAELVEGLLDTITGNVEDAYLLALAGLRTRAQVLV